MTNKMKAILLNILGGFIGSILFAGIVFFFGYLNIIPKINETFEIVQSVRDEIAEIKNNYLIKDSEGIDVVVGISTEVEQHHVIVFTDNSVGLRYSDPFELFYSVGKFAPKLQLLVTIARNRDGDSSQAEIFISKEAAETIGFRNYQKTGVVKMKARKLKSD